MDQASQANLLVTTPETRDCTGQTENEPAKAKPALVTQSISTQAAPRMMSQAMQASPPPVQNRESAAQTTLDLKELERQHRGQIQVLEEKVADLESQIRRMNSKNSELAEKLHEALEQAKVWQQVAQSNIFGQMNITILCPRAECTVNGSHVEMDSWNPTRLREEFEREVLPRFTRVFVEERRAENSAKQESRRPEAVERTMQEFAEVFRERLAVMLSAPNAAAAASSSGIRRS